MEAFFHWQGINGLLQDTNFQQVTKFKIPLFPACNEQHLYHTDYTAQKIGIFVVEHYLVERADTLPDSRHSPWILYELRCTYIYICMVINYFVFYFDRILISVTHKNPYLVYGHNRCKQQSILHATVERKL